MSQSPNVIQLFRSQVAQHGMQIAVESADARSDHSLTYAELDRRSDQIASRMRNEGVTRDSIVAVLSSRRPEMIVAVFGILKAGGAYLSLDASYPAKRLEFMVGDSQPKLLLNATDDEIPFATECKTFSLEMLRSDSGEANGATNITDISGNDLAYVIYTSGSTGVPKGVLLEHVGLAEMALAHAETFGTGPTSRVLQFSSLCFDASVHEIFMTLCSGGTLCLANSRDLIPGRELVQLLDERKITNVLLPPSALATMPDHPLPHLQTLISGGEACNEKLVKRWAGGRDFFNAYGPTEGTVTATIHKVDYKASGDPPIGCARKFASTYVLDNARNPVTKGEVGELYVGGNGIARSYLNRDELTASHFYDDQFGDQSSISKRMYRTGDLVREIEGGTLQFVGRTDRQIKVRGFRVELGEIESTLSDHACVNQAAAKLIEFGEGDSRIVAFVVARSNGEKASLPESFREWLNDRLPPQSIPSRFVLLDELPLTENQKIDYHALSLSYFDSSHDDRTDLSADNSSEAMTPLEISIHQAWCDQIGLDPDELEIDDHFVEVGGDSLLAAHISLRLEATGVAVAAQDILDHPTVRKLASFLNVRS